MGTYGDFRPRKLKYIQLTNLSDAEVILQTKSPLGMWMTINMIPRSPGYVSVVSRRYNEWQTLAFEATVDRRTIVAENSKQPLVDHPKYTIPTEI